LQERRKRKISRKTECRKKGNQGTRNPKAKTGDEILGEGEKEGENGSYFPHQPLKASMLMRGDPAGSPEMNGHQGGNGRSPVLI